MVRIALSSNKHLGGGVSLFRRRDEEGSGRERLIEWPFVAAAETTGQVSGGLR